jgi:glycine oxidase
VQSETTVDYLIAGQGLAGSCLALQLIGSNKRVMVYDQPQHNHASVVAAGLFNPLTGKVMARTWMADTLFPNLFSFYRQAEQTLGTHFFFPRSLYRPFLSVQEQNEWMGKSADPPFVQYINTIFLRPEVEKITDPFGGILLNYSGNIDVPAFLNAVRDYLISMDSYREEKLDSRHIIVTANSVRYQGTEAAGLIFCEGVGVGSNPFFSWLPINPLKGETITVAFDELKSLKYIINRGVYVVPSGTSGDFTVGATYDFNSKEPGVTQGGRDELEAKLKELIRTPYHIKGQSWGMRPTTLDQKIMIGAHPKWRNLLIFNGLGTKGVSQAPYFSAQLAGWLLGKNEIIPEVNIQRYKALYSNSE